MIVLQLTAPFAACRPMSAGWYRPSSTMITPTAAYGLILNVAAIESRITEQDEEHTEKVPSSILRNGLPQVRIAIGVPFESSFPKVQTAFQQLHNYPVDKDAGMPQEMAMETKNNIALVRRQFLSDLCVLSGIDGDQELERRIRRGLNGEFNEHRYGLPFVGDNQFLVDVLEILDKSPPASWYIPVDENTDSDPHPHATRLTTWTCRTDMSQTTSALFAPMEQAGNEIPSEAFICIPPGQNYSR